ncbi:MAG: hypothetical protein ABIO70_29545 [Pseudomonadota bacterium]
MFRPISTLGAPLLLLATACAPGEWDPHSTNTPPEASLAGNPSALTWGSVATFTGTVSDAEQGSDALGATWAFTDRNGRALELELGDDCAQPPSDTATLQGRVACTFRAPSDLDLLAVSLYGSDGRRTGDPATVEVTLDPGAAPTCTLTAPPAEPHFADTEILLDGICGDVETAPEALCVSFVDTYSGPDDQPVSDVYTATSDPQDTATPTMVLDTDD